ncbi:hypothetical protein ABIE87_003731 [Bradyrhizobium diazoefficiens]
MPAIVMTCWTPGVSLMISLARSSTFWVRSSEAPSGSWMAAIR